MITCAAIAYITDQNEPSNPYLLELDVDADGNVDPDKLRAALVKEYEDTFEDDAGEVAEDTFDDDGLEEDEPRVITVESEGSCGYGDLRVTDQEGQQIIFVTLPESAKKVLSHFETAQKR